MRLRECRIQSGLSQKFVALSLGVSGPSVANWERGKTNPTQENMVKLADLYGVTVDYLLGRSDEPGKSKQEEKPDDERELWETSQALREDPDRAMLLQLAKHGSEKDVRAAAALIGALRATNPDFYDGDDPA